MIDRPRLKRAGAALLAALLLGFPAAVRAADLSLSPTQPSVEAGKTIDFVGEGFRPGERVVTWATTPEQAVIGGSYADSEGDAGRIAFSFRVPENAVGGRWAMTAYGLASKTPVVATFEVIGRAPDNASPQAAVAPPSGPPGTTFAFAAFGYADKEKISYWFTGPDGKVYAAYPEEAGSNADGRVDITWASPQSAPPGAWVITIQGIKSNVARAVPFEIR
jgi:hypothetical protein